MKQILLILLFFSLKISAQSIFPDSAYYEINAPANFTNFSVADYTSIPGSGKIAWRVIDEFLPLNWKVSLVIDNSNTYNHFFGDYSLKSFNISSNNYLRVVFAHSKYNGYGYILVRTFVEGDSANTSKIVKFSLKVTNSLTNSNNIIVDSSYEFVKNPTIPIICPGDSILKSITGSIDVKYKILDIKIPNKWSIVNMTQNIPNSTTSFKVGDSFTFTKNFDIYEMFTCFKVGEFGEFPNSGYGYVIVGVQAKNHKPTYKQFKMALNVEAKPVKIIEDSVFVQESTSSNVNSSKLKNKLVNIKTDDEFEWQLQNTRVVLPSEWSLKSIKDNSQVHPYLGTNMKKIFNYVTPNATEDNSLEVEINHNKKEGYGYVELSVSRKEDSIYTIKKAKFSLLVKKGSSSIVSSDIISVPAYYSEDKLHIDNSLIEFGLNIYNSGGKIVKTINSINTKNIDLSELNAGLYMGVFLGNNDIIYKIKFLKQ